MFGSILLLRFPRAPVLGLAALIFCTTTCLAAAQTVASSSHLKGLSLEELFDLKVISASRTLEEWKSAPAALSVLPQEEIRGSGSIRLAEALRLAPGLHVARYVSGSYAISARGFNTSSSNKMQVMLDGRSLYTPLLSGVFWEVQDTLLEDVDRIEVIRGPGATLWGSNAVNGVINIVTKNARDTQGTSVSAGAGNEEKTFGAVRHGGKVGESTYYRTYFKYLKRDGQVFSNGSRNADGMEQSQGGFRLDATGSGGNAFTLQGDLYANRFGIVGRPDAENNGGNLLGRWTHEFSPDSELQVQTYYDRGVRDVPLQFREDRSTYDLDVQHQFKVGDRHEVVVGGNYRISEDRTAQTGRTFIFTPPDRTLTLAGGFVQDRIALLPQQLTLFLGSKFEHNDFTGWEAQPNVRLAFAPTPRQLWWAAVSRAVRAPTRVDADSRFLPDPATGFVLIRGNPAFRSEQLSAYELGYRFQPHDRVFVDVAFFENHYDHLRTLEPTPPFGAPLLIGNEREGETSGAEATVTFQAAAWWRLKGSYSYLQEDLRFKPGSRDSTRGSLEGNDPSHLATLHSAMNLPHGMDFDWTLRYVSKLSNPSLPAYLALDVRLAVYPAKNWELALVGQNLLDDRHAEFSGGASQSEVQRSVYGQVAWRF